MCGIVYKNMEIHNSAELVYSDDGESVTWLRVPSIVRQNMASEQGKRMCCNSTGVELRFVMKSDEVSLEMESVSGDDTVSTFHVYYGGIQGGWAEHEIDKFVGSRKKFVIKKPSNLPLLKKVSEEAGYSWDPEVVRIIFDRGYYRIHNVEGEIALPTKEQVPQKTIMAYGSSITHGSNSLDASSTWLSVVAHNLNMDYRNLGMAGSCAMEPEMIEYIASEGEKGHWDVALLELGINALGWQEEKIRERVSNTIRQIAGRNLQKPVFVISPLYSADDFLGKGRAERWRRIIPEIVEKENFENVTVINGLDVLGEMRLISADEVHPDIYGVRQIAQRLTQQLRFFGEKQYRYSQKQY